MPSTSAFRVVQPYGRDVARESTIISEHPIAADAFAEIESARVRDGADGCAVRRGGVIVIDQDDRIVSRPGAH